MEKENILQTAEKVDKSNKKSKAFTIIYRTICVILIIVCLCFIAFNIVFDSREISGESMQPTYNYPDSNSKDKAYYSSMFNFSRGDIIVAKKNGYNVIKRAIALEGDTLEIKKEADGYFYIFVNNKKTDESYLLDLSHNEILFQTIKNTYKTDWATKVDITFSSDSLSFVIPQNHCFYLGDNRLNSLDCADYGPVQEKDITHKVIFVVPDGTSFLEYWFKRIFG